MEADNLQKYKDDENIFAYTRKFNKETLLVILNFFDKPVESKLPLEISYNKSEFLISNYDVNDNILDCLNLRPYESRVYKLYNN